MLAFPPAKINLGLMVKGRRKDGFHEVETVMYPVPFHDALEITLRKGEGRKRCVFTASGVQIPGNKKDNLCVKAYSILAEKKGLPSVAIHLHKCIPPGSGLGGGSSNAAFTLTMLCKQFSLHFSASALRQLGAQLGSDCPFFINPVPVIARGKGERLQPVSIDLRGSHLVIVIPPFSQSTASAYQALDMAGREGRKKGPAAAVTGPIGRWRETLHNDFEEVVFPLHPELEAIKKELYGMGAVYSSLSGSGTAVYGIFKSRPQTGKICDTYLIWSAAL